MVSLFKEYEKFGYKVSAITSEHNCKLIGFYEYPQYMFSTQYSESDKILGFNSMIQEIEGEDNPDIILFDFPYGLMENIYETNYFGVYAYMLTRACKMDYFVFLTIRDLVDMQSVPELCNILKYKYDCEINATLIDNMMIDITESSLNEKIYLQQVDENTAQKDLVVWKSVLANTQAVTGKESVYKNIVLDTIDVLSNEIDEI